MGIVAKAAPPPNTYCPLGVIPKYVVSRLARNSPPNLSACRPRVQAKFCCPMNRLPNEEVIDPPGTLNPSNVPSENTTEGSVRSGVGKLGVVLVTLSDDVEEKLG